MDKNFMGERISELRLKKNVSELSLIHISETTRH